MNMRRIRNKPVKGLMEPMGSELNPAVLAVTDWKRESTIPSDQERPSRVFRASEK
ncbi:MAG: hypothetical protein BWY86_01025 [Candidatus Aminicenantes bacterium ADurb.Bin508]|nr:MAG: hypothetical protein BWY86_01025 [Candidatus Aminicenantes bacterium ADurb.Bin508]